MPVAAAAALAAQRYGHPVRFSLNRNDDLRLNGGRCYGEVEYNVGFDSSGKISAMEVKVQGGLGGI
jgi:xanthine dehydrogenase molybdopterin-binding subunit B